MRIANGGEGGEDAGVAAGTCLIAGIGIYGATRTNQTGPIIAGVVAILVALLTWYATDKRQAKALAAERQRHQETLAGERERHRESLRAERERLDARLDHERQVVDLADLRAAVEESLGASDLTFLASAQALHREEQEIEDDLAMKLESAHSRLDRGQTALLMRLHQEHPIMRAHHDLVVATGAVRQAALARDHEAFTESNAAHTVAYMRLVQAAREMLGSQLPEP